VIGRRRAHFASQTRKEIASDQLGSIFGIEIASADVATKTSTRRRKR